MDKTAILQINVHPISKKSWKIKPCAYKNMQFYFKSQPEGSFLQE